MTKIAASPRSLAEFVKDKRREACAVCRLPAEVRDQVRTAGEKKIHRRTVLDWLKTDCSAPITDTELTVHTNGHHDQ